MTTKDDVLVIGGGVIGVSIAYYLAKAGRQVTLVEAAEVCSGASYGNAGLVLPSHIVPMAAPGVLDKGLGWLLDPESPFYIKPRLSLELISWLWRFRNASKPENMRRSMRLLKNLSQLSMELYQELTSLTDLKFGYQQKGHLKLFCSSQGYREATEEAGLMKEFDIRAKMLNQSETREIEPNVGPNVVGGLYFPDDSHIVPAEFVIRLAEVIEKQGVNIQTSTEVLGFETAGSRIKRVVTTRGDFNPGQVVLAGGAWSPELTKSLRLRLPIQPAKGYSLTFKTVENMPVIPMILMDANVAYSPMGETFRVTGTLELAGLDFSINQRRVTAIMKGARRFLPQMEGLDLIEIWRGLRPCMPDGLPVIGRTAKYENLIIAAGHATLGMSLGPATGMLVSELIENKPTSVEINQLRLERFW